MSSFAEKSKAMWEKKFEMYPISTRETALDEKRESENEENFHLEAGKLLEDIFLSSLYRNEHDKHKYGKWNSVENEFSIALFLAHVQFVYTFCVVVPVMVTSKALTRYKAECQCNDFLSKTRDIGSINKRIYIYIWLIICDNWTLLQNGFKVKDMRHCYKKKTFCFYDIFLSTPYHPNTDMKIMKKTCKYENER